MRTVVVRHVLRNALLPTITVIANNVGWMFGGLIIIENLFAYPGMGSLLIQAIDTRDIRMPPVNRADNCVSVRIQQPGRRPGNTARSIPE